MPTHLARVAGVSRTCSRIMKLATDGAATTHLTPGQRARLVRCAGATSMRVLARTAHPRHGPDGHGRGRRCRRRGRPQLRRTELVGMRQLGVPELADLEPSADDDGPFVAHRGPLLGGVGQGCCAGRSGAQGRDAAQGGTQAAPGRQAAHQKGGGRSSKLGRGTDRSRASTAGGRVVMRRPVGVVQSAVPSGWRT